MIRYLVYVFVICCPVLYSCLNELGDANLEFTTVGTSLTKSFVTNGSTDGVWCHLLNNINKYKEQTSQFLEEPRENITANLQKNFQFWNCQFMLAQEMCTCRKSFISTN